MEDDILNFLWVAAFLLPNMAHADVVVYDEGVRSSGFSIEKWNGEEHLFLWDCPADKWIPRLADNCTQVTDVFAVSKLETYVKETALFYAHDTQNIALAPFSNAELRAYSVAGKHTNTDLAFDDVTRSMLDFLRNNDAKDHSPQLVMSSMMNDTLLLAVFHRIARQFSPVVLDHEKVSVVWFQQNRFAVSLNARSGAQVSQQGATIISDMSTLVNNPLITLGQKYVFVATLDDLTLYVQSFALDHHEHASVYNTYLPKNYREMVSLTYRADHHLAITMRTIDGYLYTTILPLTADDEIGDIDHQLQWVLTI